jgi:hypothetical protein
VIDGVLGERGDPAHSIQHIIRYIYWLLTKDLNNTGNLKGLGLLVTKVVRYGDWRPSGPFDGMYGTSYRKLILNA